MSRKLKHKKIKTARFCRIGEINNEYIGYPKQIIFSFKFFTHSKYLI